MPNLTRALPLVTLGLLVTACCEQCDETEQSIALTPTATADAEVRAQRAPVADPKSPEGTVMTVVNALRDHRASTVVRLVATQEELGEMRTAWTEQRKAEIDPAEATEFEANMATLTAEGAEEALFEMVQPQLAEARQQFQMLAAMGPMLAAGALDEAGAPVEAQAAIATVFAKFASLDVGSEEKAKRAIAIACRAARSLDLATAADFQALEFDALLEKGDVVYGALTEVLDVYGLGLDELLGSISVRTVGVEGVRANLEMTMDVFGAPLDPVAFTMERKGERWLFERGAAEEVPAAAAAEGALAR